MLPGEGVHVRRVVGVGAAWCVVLSRIARRGTRVRPAEAHVVLFSQRLGDRYPPGVVAGAFVLKLKIGWNLSLRALPQHAECGLGGEDVLPADLVRALVTD